MTTEPDPSLERLLAEVVVQGFANADHTLLRETAERLWYTCEVPDLALLPASHRAEAGYLVDRLARFNLLTKSRKLQILAALRPYRPGAAKSETHLKDPLAAAWGSSMDLTSRLGELMPYQTRQYAADKAKSAA